MNFIKVVFWIVWLTALTLLVEWVYWGWLRGEAHDHLRTSFTLLFAMMASLKLQLYELAAARTGVRRRRLPGGNS